jgi:hypothetical protein
LHQPETGQRRSGPEVDPKKNFAENHIMSHLTKGRCYQFYECKVKPKAMNLHNKKGGAG